MRTIALFCAAAAFGAGALVSTGASAWDGYGYRHAYRSTTIDRFDDEVPPPAYGYRSIRYGDVYHAPRYRTRRITREIIEYDDHDDFDD